METKENDERHHFGQESHTRQGASKRRCTPPPPPTLFTKPRCVPYMKKRFDMSSHTVKKNK